MHRASQTHPYFVRLFVDVDPAGNPIGTGGIHMARGEQLGTLWFETPPPFDTLPEVWQDAVRSYCALMGSQLELF